MKKLQNTKKKTFTIGVLFGKDEGDLYYEITCEIDATHRNCKVLGEKIVETANESTVILLERGFDLASDFIKYGELMNVMGNIAQNIVQEITQKSQISYKEMVAMWQVLLQDYPKNKKIVKVLH